MRHTFMNDTTFSFYYKENFTQGTGSPGIEVENVIMLNILRTVRLCNTVSDGRWVKYGDHIVSRERYKHYTKF